MEMGEYQNHSEDKTTYHSEDRSGCASTPLLGMKKGFKLVLPCDGEMDMIFVTNTFLFWTYAQRN